MPPELTEDCIVCTDGSWNELPFGPFPGQETITTGAAAVVLNKDKDILCRIRVRDSLSQFVERAFAQEYLGLALVALICHENGIKEVQYIPMPIQCFSPYLAHMLIILSSSSGRLSKIQMEPFLLSKHTVMLNCPYKK